MTERRACPRVRVSLTALYDRDVWPRPRVVSAIDLSSVGVRLETTPYSVFPDEELEISFVLHSRAIRCKEKVIHVQDVSYGKQEAGIRFEDLSEEDKHYIEKYTSQKTQPL
jgi:hypothetical protein